MTTKTRQSTIFVSHGISSASIDKHYSFQPIILIGAARSGTKLIRDVIATHPQIDKVPYDVNYIWRFGNEQMKHDELSPKDITPEIRRKVQKTIGTYSKGNPFLVEKTVSSCLRVPYAHAIFPDTRFVHLVRHGVDAVESAYRQWTAPLDWHYIVKKARTFPLRNAFGYAVSYAMSIANGYIRKYKATSGSSGVWGPRYQGIDVDIAHKDLLEVCAIQWARSVETASADLSCLPNEQVLLVRYEDFVLDPIGQLKRLGVYFGVDTEVFENNLDVTKISQQNVGRGIQALSPEQLRMISPIVEKGLELLNYPQLPTNL